MAALLVASMLWAGQGFVGASASPLSFYFIDVEGGAATLLVSPAGESILIDSGFPGERDAARIVRVARDEARIDRIDHYVTTHWHRDHVGGIQDLARLMPVDRYYGHTIPDPLPPDIQRAHVEAWRQLAREPAWLGAGDRIPLKGGGSRTPLAVHVIASNGVVAGEAAGSPQVRTCDRGHEHRDADASDNARSLGFRITYGDFDLFAGGDLTWNVEHKLVCPRPVFPVPVDAYLANHHGADSSNHTALVQALQPTVAIVNNGPRKGGEPRTLRLLLDQLGAGRVFQLHRNVRDGAVNAEPTFVANDQEECGAAFVRLTVAPDAKRYSVAIPAKNASWSFDVR
jgi:beta-lactamase superfamily II metal-dependent hydrolase